MAMVLLAFSFPAGFLLPGVLPVMRLVYSYGQEGDEH